MGSRDKTKLRCQSPACRYNGTPLLLWRKHREGGGFHLGAYCARCKAWIKWVPQDPRWLPIAPSKPEGVKA